MKLKSQWLLMALFATLPYLVLGAAGAWWLYDSGWWLWWVAWAALVSLSGWPLMKWLRSRTVLGDSFESRSSNRGLLAAGPSPDWSGVGQAAWGDVEAISKRLATEDVPLDRPELLIALAREVIETVARQFHPRSKEPLLEIPVPHVLRIAELVVHDLREACSANIPGSHILTINDLLKLKKLVTMVPTLYRLYRLVGLVVNPLASIARELNILSQEQMLTESALDTKRWALQFAVRRTGYYAIELYSGHMVLRGVDLEQYTTGPSRRAIATEKERTASLAGEPLRILILGQVKAGKSSLINAMFGETRAAVDVVPRTKRVEPFLLKRDGLQRAIILDTAGYEDPTEAAGALDQVGKELVQSDLIVLVSSALTAARDADRRLLDDVRGLFQRNPDRPFPPLVVAVTHIDQLRPFREWNPPYDLAQPGGAKARQIREAVEAIAQDLAVGIEQVIPVCLLEGKSYNVEEGLIPAILASLGDAQRLKYLRCLREFQDEEYWRRLREQAVNAGRILLKTGRQVLEEALKSP
ncbi:MAG TPA: GTPase [Planctomycetaceae bacterium]